MRESFKLRVAGFDHVSFKLRAKNLNFFRKLRIMNKVFQSIRVLLKIVGLFRVPIGEGLDPRCYRFVFQRGFLRSFEAQPLFESMVISVLPSGQKL